MRTARIAGLLAAVVVLIAATAAQAPYHTSPTPPPQPAPPSGSPSGSVAAQAKTAATHAGFAADARTISSVREHLGHAIVCIEGPRGKNVNSAWENPCQGQGSGVLNDLRGSAASWTLVAQAADDLAVAALKNTDLARMKSAAKGVGALMTLVAEGK